MGVSWPDSARERSARLIGIGASKTNGVMRPSSVRGAGPTPGESGAVLWQTSSQVDWAHWQHAFAVCIVWRGVA